MKLQKLRFTLLLAAAMAAGSLMAAENSEVTAVDEVLSMQKAGVEASVIIGYLRSVPDGVPLGAADVIELHEKGISPDVMTALILKSIPANLRLSASDIIELHEKGVPGEIISEVIRKGRQTTTEVAAVPSASAPAPKTNQTYLLAMPRTSSVLIIPHRSHYRSHYYEPWYYPRYHYYPRYYGPSYGYGFGGGFGRRYCW